MPDMMSSKLDLYEDIRPVLDAAIKAGGGSFVLRSHGEAIRWRQRAYYFRQLVRKLEQETKYDSILLKVDIKGRGSTVAIDLTTSQGKLLDREGNLLETGEGKTGGPSLADVKRLTSKLDLDF